MEWFKGDFSPEQKIFEENESSNDDDNDVSPSQFLFAQQTIMGLVHQYYKLNEEEEDSEFTLLNKKGLVIENLSTFILSHPIKLDGFIENQNHFLDSLKETLQTGSHSLDVSTSILHCFQAIFESDPTTIPTISQYNFDRIILTLIEEHGSQIIVPATPIFIQVIPYFRYEYLNIFESFFNYIEPPNEVVILTYSSISLIYVYLSTFFCDYIKQHGKSTDYQKQHSFATIEQFEDEDPPTIKEQFRHFLIHLFKLIHYNQFENVLKATKILCSHLVKEKDAIFEFELLEDIHKKIPISYKQGKIFNLSLHQEIWKLIQGNTELHTPTILKYHLSIFYHLAKSSGPKLPTIYQCLSPDYLYPLLTHENQSICQKVFKIFPLLFDSRETRQIYFNPYVIRILLSALDHAPYEIKQKSITSMMYVLDEISSITVFNDIVTSTNLINNMFDLLDSDDSECISHTLLAFRKLAIKSKQVALLINEHWSDFEAIYDMEFNKDNSKIHSYLYLLQGTVQGQKETYHNPYFQFNDES